jgi:tetratricopeptide (TPR) repeat protein
MILLFRGNYVEAEKYLDEVLEFYPTDANILYEKARCLVKQNKMEDALNYLTKAIEFGGKGYAVQAKTKILRLLIW